MLKNEIIPKPESNNQTNYTKQEAFQFPQEPLDPQVLEDARQAHRYINQLNQLWNIGHRDVKKSIYLLRRFDGNISLVIANMY